MMNDYTLLELFTPILCKEFLKHLDIRIHRVGRSNRYDLSISDNKEFSDNRLGFSFRMWDSDEKELDRFLSRLARQVMKIDRLKLGG